LQSRCADEKFSDMSAASNESLKERLEATLSRDACRQLFVDLVRVPSPQTALLEAEPQLRRFIETAVEPCIRRLAPWSCHTDAMGNLIATFGTGASGRSLMLIGHAMNHPPGSMQNPYSGEIIDGAPFGIDGDVVRGRGASEQKGTLAAMLHALDAVHAAGIPIAGTLHFVCCVSGETGTIDAIRNVVEVEGVRSDMAFLYGNWLKLALGNRGRIDMHVIVHGQSCHSSRPQEGCNAVTGAVEAVRRLTAAFANPRTHPELGPASLTINGLRSTPEATHTVQSRCDISIDRRLLPGDDPDEAAEEIERVAMQLNGMPDPVSGKPFRVEVNRGPAMHPSLISIDSPVAVELRRACKTMLGHEPQTFFAQSAFDQGYLNRVGIPAANFGPGEQSLAHTDNDIASVDKSFDAARVYAFLIANYLSEQN
jgi:acetylornithine deacetylase/succinyl-diaminopimelate desuccinylase-like protein